MIITFNMNGRIMIKELTRLFCISILSVTFIIGCDNYTHNSITNTNPANYINVDFVNNVGSNGSEWGNDVVVGIDNEIFAVGGTTSYGYGLSNIYLSKTEENGLLEWTKFYGGWGTDIGHAIENTPDSGLIIIGSTMSFDMTTGKKADPATNLSYKFDDPNFYLVKLDNNGYTFWEKAFGSSFADEFGTSIVVADDGYLLAGYTNGTSGNDDVFVIKTDFDGNIIWEETFGTTDNERAYSIDKTNDGNYIIGGYSKAASSVNSDMYLLKIDDNGILLWDKTFGESEFDEVIYSVVATSDGYAACGNMKDNADPDLSKGVLKSIKVDSDGNLIWSYTYLQARSNINNSMIESNDGSLLICGYNSERNNVILTKLEANGLFLWRENDVDGYGAGICKFPGQLLEQYIISGATTRPTSLVKTNSLIIKISEDQTNVEI